MLVELILLLVGDARDEAGTECVSPVERVVENGSAVSGIGRLPEISADARNYLRQLRTGSNSS
jgi:hypothetical protein